MTLKQAFITCRSKDTFYHQGLEYKKQPLLIDTKNFTEIQKSLGIELPLKAYYLNLRESTFMVHPTQKYHTEVYLFKHNKDLLNLADLPYHRTQTCFLVSIMN